MSSNPWHKRYHSDALAGMLSLTLEERGAFQTVLDLIYDRGAPIHDNERLLSGYMGCSIRKWRTLRNSLIEKGKITISDGMIVNERARKEIENDAKTRRKRVENGLKGGRKKSENAKKTNENNESGLAEVKLTPSYTRDLPEARSQSIPLDKSKGVKPDSDKEFWASAKQVIGGRDPGAVLNMWLKKYSKPDIANAITAAQLERAVDPIAYITAVLKRTSAQNEVVVGI